MALPLLFFIPMLNTRVFPFVAPNEEPKWVILVLCGLAMGLALAWMWRQRSDALIIRFSAAGVALFAFYTLMAASIFVAPNQVEGLIRYEFWLVSLAVWLLASWAVRQNPAWMTWLVWASTLAAVIFSLHYWWSYMLDYGKPGYNISVLFSPIGHVNFTGDVLVVFLPALIWAFMARPDPVLRVLNWFSIFTITLVLMVAASRGALGGMVLGLLVLAAVAGKYVWAAWKQGLLNFTAMLPSLLLLSSLLAATIVNLSLPYHYRDLAFQAAKFGSSTEVAADKTVDAGVEQPPFVHFWVAVTPVLGDRVPIFASSTAMIMDAPWLGQGAGNFPFVFPGWGNRYPDFRVSLSSATTFLTNPHNIVFQIAAQNGIPATLLFLGLISSLWLRLVASLRRQWNGWIAAGLVGITAGIFDSMFNHVFYNPASMFTFALLGGAWWGSLHQCGCYGGIRLGWTKPLAIGLAVATLLISIWPLRWLASEWHVGMAMKHMRQPAIARAEYEKAFALDPYNFRALFGMGQTDYAAKNYVQSIEHFRAFEAIYPYNPPALNLLGAAYMMNRNLDQAEAAFARAIKILPDYKMARQNIARVRLMKQRAEKQ
jgi:O-antigen ligase